MNTKFDKEFIMFQQKEFDFSDLNFISETNANTAVSSDNHINFNESFELNTMPKDCIEISDAGEDTIPVVYTYAKFFEILDNEGLSGLVNS